MKAFKAEVMDVKSMSDIHGGDTNYTGNIRILLTNKTREVARMQAGETTEVDTTVSIDREK